MLYSSVYIVYVSIHIPKETKTELSTNKLLHYIYTTYAYMHAYIHFRCVVKNMVTRKYLFLAERNTIYFFSILIGCWCFVVVISYINICDFIYLFGNISYHQNCYILITHKNGILES